MSGKVVKLNYSREKPRKLASALNYQITRAMTILELLFPPTIMAFVNLRVFRRSVSSSTRPRCGNPSLGNKVKGNLWFGGRPPYIFQGS